MSINTPPTVQVGQPVTPLINDNIYTLAQRIVQMIQAYGNVRLTNENGTNFWNQFVSMAVLIASHCRVYVYIYFFKLFKSKYGLLIYNENKSKISNVINSSFSHI